MTDFLLIGGLVIAFFGVPMVMSAYSEGQRPWGGGVFLLAGAGAVAAAFALSPEGYALAQIPDVALSVLARILP